MDQTIYNSPLFHPCSVCCTASLYYRIEQSR